MNKLAIAALAAVAAASAWAIQGTIKTDKDQRSGDIKWQSRTKSYSLTYKKGNTNVSAEYPIGDVERLDIEKPAAFDKLVGLVKAGQGASAIAGLSAIVKDYKMLVWDKPAGRYLVEAYLAAGQAQKAYETASGIIAEDKSAAYMGELAPAYWQSQGDGGGRPRRERRGPHDARRHDTGHGRRHAGRPPQGPYGRLPQGRPAVRRPGVQGRPPRGHAQVRFELRQARHGRPRRGNAHKGQDDVAQMVNNNKQQTSNPNQKENK